MSKVITDPYSADRIWLEYKEKQCLEKDKKALATVLATEEGRWLLERLLETTGYISADYSPDPSKMAYNAGRRSIGVEIYNKIIQLMGMQGVNIEQKAKREYIAYAEKERRLFENEPGDED